MSQNIYDKPETSLDPFKQIDKESIHDRNDLVLQQFLEKQANRKKGILDEADILVETRLKNEELEDFPFIELEESGNET